ncbi:MAG: hypothetical protein ACRC5H_08425 [Treponemataceae bacterium]
MLQFYMLSVSLNLIGGFILILSQNAITQDESIENDIHQSNLFSSQKFRLIIGVLAFCVGVFKFITPVKESVAIFGDILPAITGLCCGFSLLLEYFISTSTTGVNLNKNLASIFLDHKKYLGFFCLVIATLHFLFPQILFL